MIFRKVLGVALVGLVTIGGQNPRVHQRNVYLVMKTDQGTIEVALDSARAPVTVANFLRYVDAALMDSGVIFRTVRPDNQKEKPVKIDVIQGKGNEARIERAGGFPEIELESTQKTGLKHLNGTISMARAGPNTATDQFFVCIGDQPQLDFGGKRHPDGQGFAAFGRVTKGMDVVRKIHEGPADGENLTPPITILSIRRRDH